MIETVSEIPVLSSSTEMFWKNVIFDNNIVHYLFDSLFNIGFAFWLSIHIWNLYIIFNATEPFK